MRQNCLLTMQQQHQILEHILRCLQRLERSLGCSLAPPQTAFDLSGRAAGQYRQRRLPGGRVAHELRFNPCLLKRHFDDSLRSTVPHEVAHYAVAMLCRHGAVRPHGREWRDMMRVLGAEPEVVHHYPLEELEVRRQRRWPYRCACRRHELSTTRHRRALQGTRYLCRSCHEALRPVDAEE